LIKNDLKVKIAHSRHEQVENIWITNEVFVKVHAVQKTNKLFHIKMYFCKQGDFNIFSPVMFVNYGGKYNRS
jgi:hypothetical protein